MLTSSPSSSPFSMTSQSLYLQPEYLQPNSSTMDTKPSPLTLLAQTCNNIGKDPTSSLPSKSASLQSVKPETSAASNRKSSSSSSSPTGGRHRTGQRDTTTGSSLEVERLNSDASGAASSASKKRGGCDEDDVQPARGGLSSDVRESDRRTGSAEVSVGSMHVPSSKITSAGSAASIFNQTQHRHRSKSISPSADSRPPPKSHREAAASPRVAGVSRMQYRNGNDDVLAKMAASDSGYRSVRTNSQSPSTDSLSTFAQLYTAALNSSALAEGGPMSSGNGYPPPSLAPPFGIPPSPFHQLPSASMFSGTSRLPTSSAATTSVFDGLSSSSPMSALSVHQLLQAAAAIAYYQQVFSRYGAGGASTELTDYAATVSAKLGLLDHGNLLGTGRSLTPPPRTAPIAGSSQHRQSSFGDVKTLQCADPSCSQCTLAAAAAAAAACNSMADSAATSYGCISGCRQCVSDKSSNGCTASAAVDATNARCREEHRRQLHHHHHQPPPPPRDARSMTDQLLKSSQAAAASASYLDPTVASLLSRLPASLNALAALGYPSSGLESVYGEAAVAAAAAAAAAAADSNGAGSLLDQNHVCSWLNASTGAYCGRRFKSAEELFQHLQSHCLNDQFSISAVLQQQHQNATAAFQQQTGNGCLPTPSFTSGLPHSLFPPVDLLMPGISRSAGALTDERNYGSAGTASGHHASLSPRYHPYSRPAFQSATATGSRQHLSSSSAAAALTSVGCYSPPLRIGSGGGSMRTGLPATGGRGGPSAIQTAAVRL